jgi:hypothetical protein
VKLSEMTKDQVSLLVYLETCAVDQGGRVAMAHLNSADLKQAQEWAKAKFIDFGRLASECVSSRSSHWVKLSDDAWRVAHEGRRARFERLYASRIWISTAEKRAAETAAVS